MAARIRKIRHDEETRAKIKTSQLINRLEAHVLGKIEMKPTQVTAALGLLKKTIPDLSQQSAEVTHIRPERPVREFTDAELNLMLMDGIEAFVAQDAERRATVVEDEDSDRQRAN